MNKTAFLSFKIRVKDFLLITTKQLNESLLVSGHQTAP